MRLLRQLMGVLMLGLAFGSPVMACLIPGVEMTAAERECCETDDLSVRFVSDAPSHTCCQTSPQRDSGVSPAPIILRHVSPPWQSFPKWPPGLSRIRLDLQAVARHSKFRLQNDLRAVVPSCESRPLHCFDMTVVVCALLSAGSDAWPSLRV